MQHTLKTIRAIAIVLAIVVAIFMVANVASADPTDPTGGSGILPPRLQDGTQLAYGLAMPAMANSYRRAATFTTGELFPYMETLGYPPATYWNKTQCTINDPSFPGVYIDCLTQVDAHRSVYFFKSRVTGRLEHYLMSSVTNPATIATAPDTSSCTTVATMPDGTCASNILAMPLAIGPILFREWELHKYEDEQGMAWARDIPTFCNAPYPQYDYLYDTCTFTRVVWKYTFWKGPDKKMHHRVQYER